MVEIKLAAVIQFGFYSSDGSEAVEKALEELYGESGETYGGVMMGTGKGWSRTRFSKDSPNDEELSQFSKLTTYMAPDNRHVHDLITVGRLSEASIETLSTADPQTAKSVVRSALESIESFSSEVPVIPEGERAKRPTVFYVEPVDKIDKSWGEDGLDIEATTQWLEDHREFLQRIKILLGQPISLVGTEDFLSPHSVGANYIRRVTMLNTSSTFVGDRDTPTAPIWVKRVEGALKPYYRSDCWLNHRLVQIGEIDSETHGTKNLFQKDDSDLAVFQSREKRIEEVRRDWIDVYTRVSDEVAELGTATPNLDEEEQVPREIVIPPPASHHGEPQSLYVLYDDHIETLQKTVERDLDRVASKLDRFSQFIHDSVTARASETNVELQQEVRDLTSILIWLTVALAGIGALQFLLTIAPIVHNIIL